MRRCSTNSTVRSACLKSILENYDILEELWEEVIYGKILNSKMKARVIGVKYQMQQYDFFYGVKLALLIFRYTENLSRTLQHRDICASEGHVCANLSVQALQSIRNETSFDFFTSKCIGIYEDGADFRVLFPLLLSIVSFIED